jgi:Uncharacterised protein family (UPF0175)
MHRNIARAYDCLQAEHNRVRADCIKLLAQKNHNLERELMPTMSMAGPIATAGRDVSRRALEAVALEEGYREQTLTLYQVSEMLGLSRVETEDFLARHHVPLL